MNDDNDDDSIDHTLDGFPIKSNYYNVGKGLLDATHFDLALDAFKRGAETDGCVPCIKNYCIGLREVRKQMIHLILPWALEGAIRGNPFCINMLLHDCYKGDKVYPAALVGYWSKWAVKGPSYISGDRKETKKNFGTFCCVCEKNLPEDNGDVTLVKCGKCVCECHQLQILNKYHKPYAIEIRNAIKNGEDPKYIPKLQKLRRKLGLSKPKEDNEKSIQFLSDDNNRDIGFINARNDGTVHIGSTPEMV